MLLQAAYLQLSKALGRPGPSTSAAGPCLTRLSLEAVPLNGAVLAALTSCVLRLTSLRLPGYDLRRENGVSSRYVRASAAGTAAASGAPAAAAVGSGRAGVGVPTLVHLGAFFLQHWALQCVYDPNQAALQLALCSRLQSLSLEWEVVQKLTVLHLLSWDLDPAKRQLVSQLAGRTELVVCSLGDVASPLQPGSLPLPPNLTWLGLWRIKAAVLNALALPRSLQRLHLHELQARERPQTPDVPDVGDKARIEGVVRALKLLAKDSRCAGALTDREMGVRSRVWRRPFQLDMRCIEPPAELDFEYRSVLEMLARVLRCAAASQAPPQGTPVGLSHLRRLHVSLTAVHDLDLRCMADTLPLLEHLHLQCVLLPHFVDALEPLQPMRQLRTLVLHPGMGRTWLEWLEVGLGEGFQLFQAPFLDLLTCRERLTHLQFLLVDVWVDKDDEDDPSAFDDEDLEIFDELADQVHAAVYALRQEVVPSLQQAPGPRQGAEIWLDVRVAG
ncbi:hypothetical protein HYH02_001976 [Chlamydomonas schloesseri]|uniref:Uncharacterized protein n=1 Tax=Chlamydomonas schloesseri TaxID=2026947 RepID=A0A835WWN0_9CHLO|nr:hypothetical protein HYH02_001976 [Chlamydomonas schloesseri]|eukprot:KAG2453765.1 hypothetical protein HYH02_001976 [Chlamydomonas schloesseri]